jgi:hypothetical protein
MNIPVGGKTYQIAMVLACRKTVMGQFTLGPVLRVMRWLATAVMAAATSSPSPERRRRR